MKKPQPPSLSRKLLRLAGSVVCAYLLLLAFVFFTQRSLMYRPDPTAFAAESVGLAGVLQKVELTSADGVTLRHFYAPPANAAKPAIVYFQGNAGNLGGRAHKYLPWIANGYGVFLIGYRGYGNPGKPSEDKLYEDSRQALKALLSRPDGPRSFVLYGESLGTGVATQMALEFSPAALILEAPYTSYPDVGATRYPYLPVHLLALDRYETLAKIGKVTAPLLVIHGQSDRTVPFSQGERVFMAAHDPKKAYFVPQAGHGNLYDYGAGDAVEGFLSALSDQ